MLIPKVKDSYIKWNQKQKALNFLQAKQIKILKDQKKEKVQKKKPWKVRIKVVQIKALIKKIKELNLKINSQMKLIEILIKVNIPYK